MKALFSVMFLAFSAFACFADMASRGKPSDDPGYHDNPVLTGIFMVIAIVLVLAIGGIWLYYKIVENKQSIMDFLGKGFLVVLVLGGVLLIGKCGESIHNATQNSNEPELPQQTTPNNTPINQNNSYQSTPTQPRRTPTLQYRTVQYYETCTYCNGSGQVVCPKCNGEGYFVKKCPQCGGRGGCQTRCIYCQGKGYTEDLIFGTGRQKCFSCNGLGYSKQICPSCLGSGTKTEICDIYAFTDQQKHYISCKHCGGTGKISRTRQESYYE